MTEWWGWLASAFKVSSWRAAAIAAGGVAVFVLRSKALLPFEIPALLLTATGLATIGFGAVALFDLIAATFRGLQALAGYLREVWNVRRQRRYILRHLETLSLKEKEIFGRLLATNERSFVATETGGYANTLIAKQLVARPAQIATLLNFVYIVPEFVWRELQRRKDQFPDSDDPTDPWRVPWGV